MLIFFLVIQTQTTLIECIIKEFWLWKNLYMLHLMNNHFFTEKVVVDDDANEESQEKLSKDKQEDAPHENQEDRQEKQKNVEQQECTSQTLSKEWRYICSCHKVLILSDPSRVVTTK